MGDLFAADGTNANQIRFDIFTRTYDAEAKEWRPCALKAALGSDGRMTLHGVASSTVKDLHGDTMLVSALEDMEASANRGLTIFGNHSYDVPEDVYGTVTQASLKAAGVTDSAGDPIYDLSFDIEMNDENERAVKTWKAIHGKNGQGGAKLGLSIGAMIPEGGATREKKSGALKIAHVELLETSIVGIPANPRSWVENAVRASLSAPKQASAHSVPLGSPTLTLDTDAGTYSVQGQLADITNVTVRGANGLSFGIDEVSEPEGGWATRHEACGYAQKGLFEDGLCPKCGETGPFKAFPASELDATNSATTADPEVTDAATCPDCGKTKAAGGECSNAFHSKDLTPDVTDAKVTIIEVDTGDGGNSSQGASSSEPAGAVEDETADGDDAALGDSVTESAIADITASAQSAIGQLGPEVTTVFQRLLDLSSAMTRELVAAKRAESEALTAKAQAERERDEMAVMAQRTLETTGQILNKLADQPVGRRTVFREAETQFANLEGVYSKSFLDILRNKQ